MFLYVSPLGLPYFQPGRLKSFTAPAFETGKRHAVIASHGQWPFGQGELAVNVLYCSWSQKRSWQFHVDFCTTIGGKTFMQTRIDNELMSYQPMTPRGIRNQHSTPESLHHQNHTTGCYEGNVPWYKISPVRTSKPFCVSASTFGHLLSRSAVVWWFLDFQPMLRPRLKLDDSPLRRWCSWCWPQQPWATSGLQPPKEKASNPSILMASYCYTWLDPSRNHCLILQ